MIPKALEQIAKADLEALVRERVPESRTLEYKSKLPGGSDADKREFLADVSALANTLGGDIVYGVEEQDGAASAVVGVSVPNFDAERLRLEQVLLSGIEPRVDGIKIEKVDGFPQGPAVLIRVPQSWRSPHLVSFQKAGRFYGRTSGGKFQMEHEQIRDAFLNAELWPERFRRFRSERLAKIKGGETPVRLGARTLTIVHLMPMSTRVLLDPRGIAERRADFETIWRSNYARYNVDGYMNYHLAAGGTDSFGYCQVFRSGGAVECVDAGQLADGGDDRKLIPSTAFEKDLANRVAGYLKGLRALEVAPPYVLSVSMLGVRGFEMAVSPRYHRGTRTTIDRDELILPEILIEDVTTDALKLLRPILDAVWNAAGYSGSLNYDDAGEWREHR